MNEKLQTWRFGLDNDRLVDLVLQEERPPLLLYIMKIVFLKKVKNLFCSMKMNKLPVLRKRQK